MNAAPLLAALGRASLEGALLVLLVAAIVRALPRLPAAARCALWWLASARMVLALIALPWAPEYALNLPDRPNALDQPAEVVRRAPEVLASVAPAAIAPARSLVDAASAAGAEIPWGGLLVSVWALGAAAVVAARVREGRRLARLWRDAIVFESPAVRTGLREWLGESRAAHVAVRVTADAVTPLTLLGARPRLLLPARALELDDTSLRLVLAHEASHWRRHDLPLGLLPAIAECALWFHPFARWAAAEYAQAREEACDADALRLCAAAPRRYGELLVEFGVEPHRPTAWAASFGSSHVHHLKRRISMLASIRALTPFQRLLAAGVLVLVGGAALFPARLVGADASCGSDAAVVAASSGHGRAHGGKRDRENPTPPELRGFAVGSRLEEGVNMMGEFDTRGMRLLERFHKRMSVGSVLFLVSGAGWTTDDPAIVSEVDAGLASSRATSRQLEAISSQIGRMGELLGQLAERQAESEQRLAEAEARLDAASEELESSDLSAARRERLQRDQDRLRDLVATHESQIESLEEQVRTLEKEQDALESPQEEIQAEHEAVQREELLRMRAFADRLIRERRLQRLAP